MRSAALRPSPFAEVCSELTLMTPFIELCESSSVFLGELGGFLGLLLGASVITLFEIVDAFLYFALVKYCPRRGHKVAPPVKKAWPA
jgi:hypothetical protein